MPDDVLDPASSWPSRTDYDKKYRQLAERFIDNFRKFESQSPAEVMEAGPKLA